MEFPTLDADLRPFINRDIRLVSKIGFIINLLHTMTNTWNYRKE